MSARGWQDAAGSVDVVRVVVDAVARMLPQCRVVAGLDTATSFDQIARRPLVVVDDVLPGDEPRTAWGEHTLLFTQGFDVDVFTESRPLAVQLTRSLCRLPELLAADSSSGVVSARCGAPHRRPWSTGSPGERLYHRRGLELYVTYR